MGYFFATSVLLILSAVNLVTQAQDCPEGTVPCLAAPCAIILCPGGFKCVPTFCGSCEGKCIPAPPLLDFPVKRSVTCTYNGNVYMDGASFNSTDGCNTCFCSGEDGSVGCTKKYCPKATCQYNGAVHTPGDTFDSTDGCNTCTCSILGTVDCTEIYCPPCPVYKCKACANGYVVDSNGCQTCRCKRRCGNKRRCGPEEFCMNNDCCPNWVLSARCSDPCATLKCANTCERYCNCFARCV